MALIISPHATEGQVFLQLLSLSDVTDSVCKRTTRTTQKNWRRLHHRLPSCLSPWNNRRGRLVGTTAKSSGLDGKNYWTNSLVGMRREGELKILRVTQLIFCIKWCNKMKRDAKKLWLVSYTHGGVWIPVYWWNHWGRVLYKENSKCQFRTAVVQNLPLHLG